MEDKKFDEKKPYTKPMLETHEPLRNLTALCSEPHLDPVPCN